MRALAEVKRAHGDSKDVAKMLHEVDMLRRCQSPYVVKLCTGQLMTQAHAIHMELCDGNLAGHIRGEVSSKMWCYRNSVLGAIANQMA